MTDLEKATAHLLDCLSHCFLDTEFKADGELCEVLYITPKGEQAKGSLRINVGTSNLLFTNRRTTSGIVNKGIARYLFRGPSTIEPQWNLAKLLDTILKVWGGLDKEYSAVVFYCDGDLWTTLQCIVKDEEGTEKVLTFSFNTTVPAPVKEVKKKKDKAE